MSRLLSKITVVVFAVAALAIPLTAPAKSVTPQSTVPEGHAYLGGEHPSPEAFDDSEVGMNFAGLIRSDECGSGFEVVTNRDPSEPALCTPGPDPKPAGGGLAQAAFGPSAAGLTDPKVTCIDDGQSGPRVQLLYIYSAIDESASAIPLLKAAAAHTDTVYSNSAAAHEKNLKVRWVHDADCVPTVIKVRLSPSQLDDLEATRQALQTLAAQPDSPLGPWRDRKYLALVSAWEYCGIANLLADSRPGQENYNNVTVEHNYLLLGRVDKFCWYDPNVAAHELTHLLGSVQPDAPNKSYAYHCVDDYDLMCYDDDDPATPDKTVIRIECPDYAHESLLDCNRDDYFNPTPPPGSYLDTHWNIANSRYLVELPYVSPTTTTTTTTTTLPKPTTTSTSLHLPTTTSTTFPNNNGGNGGGPVITLPPVGPIDGGDGDGYGTGGGGSGGNGTGGGGSGGNGTGGGGSGGNGTGGGPTGPDGPVVLPIPFLDTLTSPFKEDIDWLSSSGITKGCNPPLNSRFCPDTPVTRGQMAAFLVRALGLKPASVGFSDTAGHVFAADIAALANAGITRGCNPPRNDRFCPDAPVTRGQMAAFLVRALGLKPANRAFVDTASHVFAADIAALADAGITKGCNPPRNDRFCPDDPVTRGQMAAFLHRALRR